jgi:signal peptidase I
MPGDKIHFKNDELFINDKLFDEPYLASLKQSIDGGKLTGSFNLLDLYGAKEVPSGQYFVLGDNRLDSLDSRHPYVIGLVNDEQILGEVELIFFPFSNMKWIK